MIVVSSVVLTPLLFFAAYAGSMEEPTEGQIVVIGVLTIAGTLILLAAIIGGPIWGGLRVGRRLNRDYVSLDANRLDSDSGNRDHVTTICPNCGAEKHGKFCGTCGQNDRDYRRLIPALFEIVAEIFEADSRVWRTLRALLFRPGFLSLEFVHNRRAHYISPFRLYLFASVPYFLTMSYIDNPPPPTLDEGALADAIPAATNLSNQMPNDLLYEYLPIAALAILPLYASLLQFIFIDRRVYAESFVFVLHFTTITFLILLVFSPWMTDYDAPFWQYFMFLVPLGIYLLVGLKHFYGAGWLLTTAGWFAALMIFIVLFFVAVLGTAVVVGLFAGYDLSEIFAETR